MEGLKFTLLNPKETIDRFLKEQEEIALTRNARLFAELGLGIATAQAIAKEATEHKLGYTDLEKLGEQATLVQECFNSEKSATIPSVTEYASNDSIGSVTLTRSEWDQVRGDAAPYAKYVARMA